MAGTLKITCPKCQKVMQVPEVLGGKRIRCRGCNATVSVPKPVIKATTPPKTQHEVDDEWAQAQAYGLVKDDDKPRCPFCANDVEDGQVICLKCGYNMVTRERHGTSVLHATTGSDYTLWLLPGILCALVALICIALTVILWTGVPRLGDFLYDNVQDTRWGRVYGSLFLLAITWFTGVFAVKRLILHPHPPDVEKHEHDAEEDDEDD